MTMDNQLALMLQRWGFGEYLKRFEGKHVLFVVNFVVTFNKLKRTPESNVISFGRVGSLFDLTN